MEATATYSAGTLTVTIDGASETMKCKTAPAFVVVGTGNPYTATGVWFQRRGTRAAAEAVRVARGGTVVKVK